MNGPFRPQDFKQFQPVQRFPYLGFSDVKDGIQLDAKSYQPTELKISNKKVLMGFLSRLQSRRRSRKQRVAVIKPSSVNQKEFIQIHIRQGYGDAFLRQAPLVIPNLARQLQLLCEEVERIAGE